MKYLKTLTIFLFILSSCCCLAQKENNNWVFGKNCGISFNANPVSFFPVNIDAIEASASVSDRNTGVLLFYCDGVNVYDRNGATMPNGAGVGIDTGSTNAQGTIIIPHQSVNNLYYMFTIEPVTSVYPNNGILRYSLVDMSLRGGLGDVVAGQKGIEIGNGFSEMNTSAASCSAVWLLCHKRNTLDFYAYKVGGDGLIATPVLSSFPGGSEIVGIGNIKASPDRKLVAMAHTGSNTWYAKVRLFDFDSETGRLSNSRILDSAYGYGYYGCDFSANSHMLYTCGDSLTQFDLTEPSAQLIFDTKVRIPQSPQLGWSVQLGPDKNIYIAYSGKNLVVVGNADNKYPACTLSPLNIPGGTVHLGLPQMVRYAPSGFSLGDDRVVCAGTTIDLTIDVTGATYLWNNGSSTARASFVALHDTMVYAAATVDGCTATDTLYIHVHALQGFTLGNDTALCAGDILHITVADTMNGYRWSNGNTGNTIDISTAGTYWLEAGYKGCTFADTIKVDYPPQDIELGDNRTLCNGDTLVLKATSAIAGSTYRWQDGSTVGNITVNKAGTYWVSLANPCGAYSDTVKIAYEECDCRPFVPSAFTPNGDGLNDKLAPILSCTTLAYHFVIANRYGQIVFKSNNAADKWDGRYKGVACETGTYFYYLEITGPRNRQYLVKGDITLLH